ncbi:hypothetical protein GCM10029963_47710 [Micromonospora andamanensis]
MSQMNRRRALQLLAALGTGGLVAACGSDAEPEVTGTESPIKIGLIAPQSGASKAIGDELSNGFELYLDLNERRLGGHPVDLITADEGDNVKSGQAAVEGLLKQGVLALTGVANSSVMFGIKDIVEQARVPLIGSNASPASLQSVVYIWRTSYVLDEAGRALGRYLKDELARTDKIATILPEGVVGVEDVLRGFREEFGEADPRIASQVVWTSGSSSPGRTAYVSDINRALASNPAVVFCFYSGAAAVEFIMQLRDAGFRGRIYAPGFLTEGSVLEDIRPATDALGIRTALNYSADLNNAANRRFASAYRKSTTPRRPRTRWPRTTRQRCSTRRSGSLARTPPRSRSTSPWAGSGRSTAHAVPGSSTSRVRPSRSGTCARCSATVRWCRTCLSTSWPHSAESSSEAGPAPGPASARGWPRR